MTVVTRIAPSPTGYLHFGLARTALFSYLYAKKHGGEFIIRIEDTDVARNKPEYEEDIHEQFKWLGLIADRVYRQSENRERHRQLLVDLVERDVAYISKEPAKDDATQEIEVVRLRNKGEKITFNDGIRGDITFDTTELKDFVIARSVNDPLYHFAVVVDDFDEGVTHVIRGDDHISNTPRQILILKALGFTIPEYTHLPLILMPDKSKMSKRKHETAVKNYREKGFFGAAMINYLATLGWTPADGKEVLSLEELLAEFDLAHVHKSGAVFDIEKLRWFNRSYVQQLSDEAFTAYIEPVLPAQLRDQPQVLAKLLPVIRDNISVLEDVLANVAAGEYLWCYEEPMIDASNCAALVWKNSTGAMTLEHLRFVQTTLSSSMPENATAEQIKEVLWEYASTAGKGDVLWPMRYALTGRDKSPDPFIVASILGKDATLRRLEKAIAAFE
ncbi:MAG: glutamyl-tRNA synthetase, glutamyl-tRNA synthetase [Candidatus Kaiserbacteria bacterium]|nr:glutamyl-tRNA synthetase, glutamyl-tRNA synthetase [Candidatus Kaiserbacteria bacterium]